MAWKIVCIVCDAPGATLRRLKPAKLYACVQCVKEHGGIAPILADIATIKNNFLRRQAMRERQLHQRASTITRKGEQV